MSRNCILIIYDNKNKCFFSRKSAYSNVFGFDFTGIISISEYFKNEKCHKLKICCFTALLI